MRTKLGAVIPQTELPADPAALRDFAQAIESLGYDHLVSYDHILGADIGNRPGWGSDFTNRTPFFEPLSLFSFLAGVTDHIGFTTGVLVLPLRQTALVAKQTAMLDLLSRGRLRLGVGAGYNAVEFEGMGVPLAGRGERFDEQIALLRALWTQASITFSGRYHTVSEAGLCPLPLQQPIPLWIGGNSPAALARAARLGDGWMPVLPAAEAGRWMTIFHDAVRQAGRNPAEVGFEIMISAGATRGGHSARPRSPVEVAQDSLAWIGAGATHVSVQSMDAGLARPEAQVAFFERLIALIRN